MSCAACEDINWKMKPVTLHTCGTATHCLSTALGVMVDAAPDDSRAHRSLVAVVCIEAQHGDDSWHRGVMPNGAQVRWDGGEVPKTWAS